MGEIFGDVPNVAARAQALPEPGSVVVTARVQRQVAAYSSPRSAAVMQAQQEQEIY
jgi:class 3 adenylate cyclase